MPSMASAAAGTARRKTRRVRSQGLVPAAAPGTSSSAGIYSAVVGVRQLEVSGDNGSHIATDHLATLRGEMESVRAQQLRYVGLRE